MQSIRYYKKVLIFPNKKEEVQMINSDIDRKDGYSDKFFELYNDKIINSFTFSSLIVLSKFTYNNLYTYKLRDEYANVYSKISIVCDEHNHETPTTLYEHIYLYKFCSKCDKKLIYEQLLNKLFFNRYQYFIYIEKNFKYMLNVHCPIHSTFTISLHEHLFNKIGCSKCILIDLFISHANNANPNKFKYNLITQLNSFNDEIDIQCFKGHNVKYTAKTHFVPINCSRCNPHLSSKTQFKWLDSIEKECNEFSLQHAKNFGEFTIPTTNFKVDGFCKNTNTVFEFLGCYFHGCLKCRHPKKPFFNSSNMQVQNNITFDRFKKIKNLGYNIHYIWACEFENINNNVLYHIY